jgi:hypothetical protein
MIFTSNAKPKGADAPVKLRHILADQVKPKVFDFDRNRYAETHPKRKPGGPMLTSQLGDIAAARKRAEVAAIPDVAPVKVAPAPAPVAEVVKKKVGRPRKK